MPNTHDADTNQAFVDRAWLSARLTRAGWTLNRFCASHGFSSDTRVKLNKGLPLKTTTANRVITAASRLPVSDDVPPEALGRSA